MRRFHLMPLFLALVIVGLSAVRGWSAMPSDKLLPATTKGYLSIPDSELLSQKFDESQLGQLCNDPLMKPFADDLKRQLRAKFSEMGVKLGVTIDELNAAVGGELAVALVQPDNDKSQHALVVSVDVTGKREQAVELLAKIERNQLAKGAKKGTLQRGAIELTTFTLPKKKGQTEGSQAFFFLHADQLVATDHAKTATELADRLLKPSGSVLADVPAYNVVMQRAQESGHQIAPHLRWFVEPFGYAEVNRAAQGGRKKRGTDLLKVLANQGFKAVQGLGGYVTFSTGEHELLHRSFVYAPADPKAEAGDKYRLAARMMNFPNTKEHSPRPWVPQHLANHFTFQVKIKEAFEYVGSLVDEVAGEPGVFEEVLRSIEIDRSGPQVNLRKELVAYAGERVTVITDVRLPVTTKSERLMFGVEVTNPAMVARAINKIMEADPNAHKHEIDGHIVWEIVNDDGSVEVETLMIEGSEFVSKDEEADEEEEEKPVIPNSAVTVAHGHLIIATHVDYIKQILVEKSEPLASSPDYEAVTKALLELGADEDSFRLFTRTDEAYRATYELIRQGKMPESETLFGKLLNKMLGPDEEGVLREQEIDGSKMPEFETMIKYLGAAGAYVRSQDDGWLIVGCLLKK
ncbi:MAG: hypothetical protein U0935_20825 [Pirellulales bacterium]